jgi:hypothetical protein
MDKVAHLSYIIHAHDFLSSPIVRCFSNSRLKPKLLHCCDKDPQSQRYLKDKICKLDHQCVFVDMVEVAGGGAKPKDLRHIQGFVCSKRVKLGRFAWCVRPLNVRNMHARSITGAHICPARFCFFRFLRIVILIYAQNLHLCL